MKTTQRRLNNIFLIAIVDTCTFAVFYGGLRSPGDPKRLSGSLNVDEYIAMGNFAMAEARAAELETEYRYARAGAIVGCFGIVLSVGAYVHLVMTGHSRLAVGLLGLGIASLIGANFKSRF